MLQGGSWLANNLPPSPFNKVTFTATMPGVGGFGNRSEFYALQADIELAERQGGGEPQERRVMFVDGILPVTNLKLIAEAVPVMVQELKLIASGTLDELAQLESVRLFRDADRDGQVSERDEEIADAVTFMAVDGEITFDLQ